MKILIWVFLFNKDDVDYLSGNKANLFEELFLDRENTKRRYSCDVYYADINDRHSTLKWMELFGFDKGKLNTKGIFKIRLNTYGKH